jgi:hypothetical protein
LAEKLDDNDVEAPKDILIEKQVAKHTKTMEI